MKILILHTSKYYIWDYLFNLVPVIKDGSTHCQVLTFDKELVDSYKSIDVEVILPNWFILKAYKASSVTILRPFSWVILYFYGFLISRNFDYAITPWDYKIFSIVLSKFLNCCTIHNSYDLCDINLTVNHLRSSKKHNFIKFFERFVGIKIGPRAMNHIMQHKLDWYIDKFFGSPATSYIQGFSGAKLMTVTGNKVKENLLEMGFDTNSKTIAVVGNPSYQSFLSYTSTKCASDITAFKKAYGFCKDADILTLFLSPTNFSKSMLEELNLIINILSDHEFKYPINLCVKLHPKTNKRSQYEIKKMLDGKLIKSILIKEYHGEKFNLDLIFSSKAIIQKQSTVGFLAMILNKPIISYNIIKTDYGDSLYETLDCSIHCKNSDQLSEALFALDDNAQLEALSAKQKRACHRYCIAVDDPCERILEAIKSHTESFN